MAKNEARGAREPHRPKPTPPKGRSAEEAVAPAPAPSKNFKQVADLCKRFDTHEEAAAYRDTLVVDPNKNKTRIRRRGNGQFETLYFAR